MADVFISYSHSFPKLTEETAKYLEKNGYSVWWDVSLVGGEVFRKTIVAQIKACKAAVVIWNSASIDSDWVYSEASRAYRQKKLIPVKVADIELDDIPPPFDALHIVDYTDRDGLKAAVRNFVEADGVLMENRRAKKIPSSWLIGGWLSSLIASVLGTYLALPPVPVPYQSEPEAKGGTSGWKNVFISYRRQDAKHIAPLIAKYLEGAFGKEMVFMDIESIPMGADFAAVIKESVNSCDGILALIGVSWISASDEGLRRIDNPSDFVHIELSQALTAGKPIIPVLIDDAHMPSKEELPPSLSPLASRNALRIRSSELNSDLEKLVRILKSWQDEKDL